MSVGSLNSFESPGPDHQFSLMAITEIHQNINVTSRIRYVDDVERQGIPDYLTGDISIGWQVTPYLAVFASGQDLFEDSHVEFISEMSRISTGVERRFQFDLKFTF